MKFVIRFVSPVREGQEIFECIGPFDTAHHALAWFSNQPWAIDMPHFEIVSMLTV